MRSNEPTIGLLIAVAVMVLPTSPASAARRGCPTGMDGKPLITGPARCLEPFQRDLLHPKRRQSGELRRHRRNADRLLRRYPQ